MERLVMRYTQDEDQIIDIINNGFLKVFLHIGSYNGEGSFEGWIRKIIYRSLSDYFRKSKKDLKFLIYEQEYSKTPTEEQNNQLYYQDLISLVNKLPELQMRVFHLHAIEGYNHKEISDELNINYSTCRWYLAEARKQLQEEYKKQFAKNYNEAG
jgi:RNA polymerase sigma-70 factor (ECF subfamily)